MREEGANSSSHTLRSKSTLPGPAGRMRRWSYWHHGPAIQSIWPPALLGKYDNRVDYLQIHMKVMGWDVKMTQGWGPGLERADKRANGLKEKVQKGYEAGSSLNPSFTTFWPQDLGQITQCLWASVGKLRNKVNKLQQMIISTLLQRGIERIKWDHLYRHLIQYLAHGKCSLD
jgi:hypothetical protein